MWSGGRPRGPRWPRRSPTTTEGTDCGSTTSAGGPGRYSASCCAGGRCWSATRPLSASTRSCAAPARAATTRAYTAAGCRHGQALRSLVRDPAVHARAAANFLLEPSRTREFERAMAEAAGLWGSERERYEPTLLSLGVGETCCTTSCRRPSPEPLAAALDRGLDRYTAGRLHDTPPLRAVRHPAPGWMGSVAAGTVGDLQGSDRHRMARPLDGGYGWGPDMAPHTPNVVTPRRSRALLCLADSFNGLYFFFFFESAGVSTRSLRASGLSRDASRLIGDVAYGARRGQGVG